MSSQKVLVVGSGVIGLRTSLSLLNAGHKVLLRSATSPLSSKMPSVGAGGLWLPFHCEDSRVGRWAQRTLDDYMDSHALGCPDVSLVPTVMFKGFTPPTTCPETGTNTAASANYPFWASDPRLKFQSLATEQLRWQNDAVLKMHIPPALLDSYPHAWTWVTPIIDCPAALSRYLSSIQSHPLCLGVSLSTPFPSVASVQSLASSEGCSAVVHCGGYTGGRTLLSDSACRPARGVLRYYKRPSSFNTCLMVEEGPLAPDPDKPLYAIPRGGLIALGGSYLLDDEEMTIRPSENKHLDAAKELLLGDGEEWVMESDWVGLRPHRDGGVKLEINKELTKIGGGLKWVDNYGHGGSGWTIAKGCAEDVVDLIEAR